MKSTTMFVCQECGYETPKFLGRCPECGLWNTLKEFKIQGSKLKSSVSASSLNPKPEPLQLISEVSSQKKDRISTGISEMDTVLGGGIVAGSVTLLAGDPGIGKSTLLLQVALNLSLKDNILYISGEESESQVKLRAERLSKNLKNNKLFLVALTDPDSIVSILEENKPSFV